MIRITSCRFYFINSQQKCGKKGFLPYERQLTLKSFYVLFCEEHLHAEKCFSFSFFFYCLIDS